MPSGLNASAPPAQWWVDGWLVRAWPGKARRARCVNALAPGAVADTKRLMRAPLRARIREVMAAEGVLFGQRLRSPEAMEAFQAFFQKRKPDFSKF